ncbi:MAG TPA: MTAP family purine nucleoside phosphorylase [Methylomusa anaerophila]|uniref:S-methyl-5'-thioinosine phosphorylase n=1 Tax=Methylomusa anaerophila TaxID=1930071 RepID=A0A348AML5_9FIRM|nr:MTAP family purine nucleoside phosphorylase [Methylomusa anaerophila]BBB92313.1 S-methyl-5'-thioinosine phosphorylase [Methylomusa anaerophila]HML90226.1 MTAP family purine nucleoside phosphorylase [Methylomusa anaerophila]
MDLDKTEFAVIGGSGTLSGNFPLGVDDTGIELLGENLAIDTPYGRSPAFRLFSVDGQRVLTCKMHGWRSGVSRADASRQIFWVFRQIGVKRIIAEGGVGSANHLLDPRDFIIPHDYIDLSLRKDVGLEGKYLLVMREALCPEIRSVLIDTVKEHYHGRVFARGIYAVTEGRHFESPAEVAMLKGHADIIGQSLCPEVYLAREIGACYAGLYFVVNYGEGVVKDWSHQELTDIFFNDAPLISKIILAAIRKLSPKGKCGCSALRKETLLKEVYK